MMTKLFVKIIAIKLFTVCLTAVCLTNACGSDPFSLDEQIAITKKYEVDYLAQEAKKNPESVVLKQVSNKLSSAFETIQRTKHPLNKPYLVNVFFFYRVLNVVEGEKETYHLHIEWFEDRYVSHSIQFKNTETLETWVYNFQSDFLNTANKTKGIRFIQEYRFGSQPKGGMLVPIEDGIRLAGLAKTGKLRAVFLNKEGEILSNTIKVDYVEFVQPSPASVCSLENKAFEVKTDQESQEEQDKMPAKSE